MCSMVRSARERLPTWQVLPPHPGVDHEHYALHVWFVENPSGWSADFNPRVTCPLGSTPPPGQAPAHSGHWPAPTGIFRQRRSVAAQNVQNVAA